MVAPDHDREGAFFVRLVDLLVHPLADPGNFANVALLRVAGGLGLGDWRDQITSIEHHAPDAGETFPQTGDSDGRWTHVDPAAAPAKIERDTDDVHGPGLHREDYSVTITFASMTPIFVRPVREQAEHDRLIRFLQNRYKRKFDLVSANVGEDHSSPVKIGKSLYFPDLVLSTGAGKKISGVAEIESAESVNNLEAMAQWVPFSRAKIPFLLYVPVQAFDLARRLLDANGVTASEIWTYRPTFDGFDLIRMHHDPVTAKDFDRPDRPERIEKSEKTEVPLPAAVDKKEVKAPPPDVKVAKEVKVAKDAKVTKVAKPAKEVKLARGKPVKNSKPAKAAKPVKAKK